MTSSRQLAARRVFALAVAVFVPACAMIWYRARESSGFAGLELIVYPLLFGGIGIALIAILKSSLLGSKLGSLNAGPGRWTTDLVWGAALCVAYFLLAHLERATLAGVLQPRPNLELLGLMLDMRENPWLLVLWFGPVLWVGIAAYEEVLRTFMLAEMWAFSDTAIWATAVVVISAALFGLIHWVQGPYGIVTIAIKGVVAGVFYLRTRRLLPLIIAHAFYDGIQVGMLLATYPES